MGPSMETTVWAGRFPFWGQSSRVSSVLCLEMLSQMKPGFLWAWEVKPGQACPGLEWCVQPGEAPAQSSALCSHCWTKGMPEPEAVKYRHVEWRDLDKADNCFSVSVPEFPGSLAVTVSYGFNFLKTVGSFP